MSDQKIILTRGLPASGKSRYANHRVRHSKNLSRVNRDDIRMMLQATAFGGTIDEDLVSEVEISTAKAILASGRSVIVDATHLYQRYINRWQKLGYPVEIVEFTAPKTDLLIRNANRDRQVPVSVIEEMWKKFVRNDEGDLIPVKTMPEFYETGKFEPYEPSGKSREAFIFDIDGTLAHMAGRSPYDYSQVHTDTADEAVARVLNALEEKYFVVIVSGRDSGCRSETEKWLSDNFINHDGLYMRADGDKRPDTIIKYEILRNEIAPRYDVVGVFDDRNSVVEMWRNIGLKCFHVQDGNF